jgi:putative DNA primase/helicase
MNMTTHDIVQQVLDAMRGDGIEVLGTLEADGCFHRVRITGDKGSEKTGWAVIHTNEPIRAVYGNNRFGHDWKKYWRPEGQAQLTRAETERMRQQVAEAQRERAREKKRRQAQAAARAAQEWGRAVEEPGDHPYLQKKGVMAHSVRRLDGKLLVPARDTEGVLHTLQAIDGEGGKRFLPGGAVEGHFHLLGEVDNTVLVCEGLATGASLREATGMTVAVAFDAGNLLPVARALRKAWPKLRLIVAADNDQYTASGNTGLTKAREVAATIKGVTVIFPAFTEAERASKPTDYNDLAALRGPEALQQAVEASLQAANTKPSTPSKKRNLGDSCASVSEQAPPVEVQRSFLPIAGGEIRLLTDGVYFIGQGGDGDPLPPMKICSPLRISASTRNAEGGDWGRLLEWEDPDGQPHQWALPMEMLAGEGVEVRAELMRGGIFISPGKKSRDILGIYLQVWLAPARALCVDRTGWHGRAFVLPNETFGGNGERVVFQSTAAQGNAFRAKGELQDWIERVARPAQGNTRLMLVLCAAFAAPLLVLADLEGGGIHLLGTSSIGKTVALELARSVFAAPEGLHRWRTTSNGLEATAAAHNHLPLPLDEISQLESKEASEVGYALGNGTEKARATRTGSARPRRTWRLIFISSGEVSLADRAAEAGRRVNAGAEVRVLNIPARVGGYGIFNSVPDELRGNSAEFAKQLTEATSDCYGTAGPAFVRYLVEHHDALPKILRNAERAFAANMVGDRADGQVHRAGRRFALFAAAGELAVAAGVLPWRHGQATEAIETCFRDWLKYRGGSGAAEDREALAQVRRVLEAGREARFSAWSRADDDHAPRTQDMFGYKRNDSATGGETHFYISAERFKADVCKGLDARTVAKLLKVHKYLVHDDGRYTLNARLPGQKETERFYAVRAAILEGEGDDD